MDASLIHLSSDCSMHQLVRRPQNQSILNLTIAFAARVDKGQDGPGQIDKQGRTRFVVRLIISYLWRSCYWFCVAHLLLASQPASSQLASQPASQPPWTHSLHLEILCVLGVCGGGRFCTRDFSAFFSFSVLHGFGVVLFYSGSNVCAFHKNENR